jgi:ABC-type transport system involved in multi-copper enzyme maturation permease subunit
MTFLPVVQRELREAARRKSTFRIRYWTAIVAMVGSFCMLPFIWLNGASREAGGPLFTLLTSYAFGLCMLSGVFLTADSLSEEKREGTLGLLFLTDLHGYDVVLGKFIGRSLNAFYGLFALLPITALPLLLGGVTGHEFWRMALALVNVLFFSLAAGMWVSSWSREPQTALSASFLLLLFFGAGLPAAAVLLDRPAFHGVNFFLSANPFFAFTNAREASFVANAQTFWTALVTTHLLGWLFLALASFSLPYGIREGDRPDTKSSLAALVPYNFGGRGAAERGPREWMARNPVFWLIGNEPVLRRLLWMLVALWGITICTFGLHWRGNPLTVAAPAKAWGFLLKVLVALQASRFFIEARRTGILEVLLCTPLRKREIIKGQLLALKRIFGWPLFAFMLLGFVPLAFQVFQTMKHPTFAEFGDIILLFAVSLAGVGLFTLSLLADFFAVVWVGMWLGLSMKKVSSAPALTVLLVLIIPSVGSPCGLDMLADLFFILWGVTKLQQDFRWVLARQYR